MSTSLRCPYMIVDEFLESREAAELLVFACSREAQFIPALVSAGDPGSRTSLTLPTFEHALGHTLRRKMLNLGRVFSSRAKIEASGMYDVVLQLSAYNDGAFFRLHRDRTSTVHADRLFTCVYYLHRHPKHYRGGLLRLYAPEIVSTHELDRRRKALTYAPRHNSLIIFSSNSAHEVTPVQCESRKFVDSRFAITGWILQST